MDRLDCNNLPISASKEILNYCTSNNLTHPIVGLIAIPTMVLLVWSITIKVVKSTL